jgi:hypothetical protein
MTTGSYVHTNHPPVFTPNKPVYIIDESVVVLKADTQARYGVSVRRAMHV